MRGAIFTSSSNTQRQLDLHFHLEKKKLDFGIITANTPEKKKRVPWFSAYAGLTQA